MGGRSSVSAMGSRGGALAFRQSDNAAATAAAAQRCGKLGHFVDLAYSGCKVIKTQLPKIGSKFGPDEFRINSLCMSFYNHITTVR